ncbi:hypothetical protein [Devosia sp.]|uniref:hypothetical protein n=1 Tax=Devosia sp. TaxID=1871048 RepID=UPI001B12738C|nr:hypothetical protein [Devosia sp.]MBO9589743.1 hypothetical protein [Devosia sp.]
MGEVIVLTPGRLGHHANISQLTNAEVIHCVEYQQQRLTLATQELEVCRAQGCPEVVYERLLFARSQLNQALAHLLILHDADDASVRGLPPWLS